ncbi:hypothetical protein NECAME_08697 [Necator americanus]|uniref:Uncharacterized protein n=1 Tax=Necator americanus TaxID=51031 RepID=W2TJM3_NECAM|nr:hypothetical protein NECAME_08697 [Necator americanus]ETN81217.1 hypothetical protein NECAME_08697 [Necator americanus]
MKQAASVANTILMDSSVHDLHLTSGTLSNLQAAVVPGTGSTSWYFNINKLTEQCVSELLAITSDRCKV